MTATLQIKPATSPNIIRFDPAAPSNLVRRASVDRPVRARSLALALAVGVLIGGLISLSASDGEAAVLTGDEVKTEVVGG